MSRTVEIKTADPRMAAAIAEGASVVELRALKAENEKLHAKDGVRAIADEKRWQRTSKRLARKYSVKPVGRARGAILGVWALVWTVLLGMTEFAARESMGGNRHGAHRI